MSAGKTDRYLRRLRHRVSGDRLRYQQSGFDLDLVYITDTVISMSMPSVGREAFYRNPQREVARFLNERHFNKYLVLNATYGQPYKSAPFFNRIYNFPIEINGVPALEPLVRLCQIIECFLQADPGHTLAVHAKNGQGRSCLIIGAYLLYSGTFQSASMVISHLEGVRSDPDKFSYAGTHVVDCWSQRRFLEYFAYMIHRPRGHDLMKRRIKLTKMHVFGMPNVGSLDVVAHTHRGVSVNSKGIIGRRSRNSARISVGVDPAEKAENLPSEGSIEEEEELEDDLDDLMAVPVRRSALLEGISKIREEAALDSYASGATAIAGNPVFSSDPESNHSANVTVAHQSRDPLAPGTWQFRDVHFEREFRIEVHRRKPRRRPLVKKAGGAMNLLAKLRNSLPGQGKPQDEKEKEKFDGGMLCCFWLHSGYLEHDEPPEMAVHLRHSTRVIVVLERFTVDKSRKAPPLRSYPTTFKVELELEVEKRVDMRDDLDERHAILATSITESPSYTLEWLTWFSSKIWPSFRNGLEKLISEDILPGIFQSLPGPLKGIRLTHCSFGDAFPKFGPISASSRSHDGLEVQMDLFMDYSTDTNIVIDAGIASFSINHVKIAGLFSVKFTPILGELPVFAAIQLLFLNPPEIDLKFGDALEVANWSMAKNAIKGAITKNVSDLMVLPNVICINWGDPNNDSTLSFKGILPSAVMMLAVVEACNMQTDACSIFKRLPNSKCSVSLGSQEATTRSVEQTTAPVWQESFDFLVYDERQHVNASLIDTDFAGRAHSVGVTSGVAVRDIVAAGDEGLWVDLQETRAAAETPATETGKAKVLLSAILYDLVADPRRLPRLVAEGGGCNSDGNVVASTAGSPKPQGRMQTTTETQSHSVSKDTKGMACEDKAEGCEACEKELTQEPISFGHAGAVALLVCQVCGVFLPEAVASKDQVSIQVQVGQRHGLQVAQDTGDVDAGAVSEKGIKSIQRLRKHGMEAHQIAESLGEDLADVQRILRQSSWNLEVVQKIPLLLHPSDLRHSPAVEVTVLSKSREVARGMLPFERLMQTVTGRLSEIVKCLTKDDSNTVQVEVEFRLFALEPRPPPPAKKRPSAIESKSSQELLSQDPWDSVVV